MSKTSDKSLNPKSLFSVQTIVLSEITWAILALLFFLLFSVSAPGAERPAWYSIGTSVFEAVAFLVAAILCFRNWRSPQIVSGRNVWLGIGLGMLSYFIGNLLFSYWELGINLVPTVSPGDLFFVLTYLFLAWGMVLAVISRRLNLVPWQWGIVVVIGAIGILLGFVVYSAKEDVQSLLAPRPAIAQTAPPSVVNSSSNARLLASAPSIKPSPAAGQDKKTAATASPTASPATVPQSGVPDSASDAPTWALNLENTLAPLEGALSLFYVISDVVLLIIATTLLLAFWGGRFSQSWRMIAAAAFCLYIADVWFTYASNRFGDGYQSGSLPEVFWVFSGVLFGIGAALEYDLSNRSRRAGGRRRS